MSKGWPAILEMLRGGLIVSCQAGLGHPLHGPALMAAMACAAAAGGAVAVRVDGEADIAAVRAVVNLPVIGIRKVRSAELPVYITPTFDDARIVAGAGAHIIALDATARLRLGDQTPAELIARIHDQLKVPVMADVSTFDEGIAAAEMGADLVATTLSGYTGDIPPPDTPDLDLVGRLAATLAVPVVAEGRYRTREQVESALDAGAFAVVVGRAITDPVSLTRALVPGRSRARS